MTPAQGTTTAAHKTAHKTSRKTTRAKADVSAKTAAAATRHRLALFWVINRKLLSSTERGAFVVRSFEREDRRFSLRSSLRH